MLDCRPYNALYTKCRMAKCLEEFIGYIGLGNVRKCYIILIGNKQLRLGSVSGISEKRKGERGDKLILKVFSFGV
jgi:hypothetical protein